MSASAAYQLRLPALDGVLPFNTKDGTRREERLILTDGGTYDNLGLAPLWPDRDPEISLNVTKVDTIICCRAGYGPRFDAPTQFFLARMKSVFSCIFDRTQNAATKRLFDLLKAGELKGVIMPYLGQNDARLACPPDDLVTREDAFAYPTDFSALVLTPEPGEDHAACIQGWLKVLKGDKRAADFLQGLQPVVEEEPRQAVA